jgi:hypothetical protein
VFEGGRTEKAGIILGEQTKLHQIRPYHARRWAAPFCSLCYVGSRMGAYLDMEAVCAVQCVLP